MPTGPLPDSLVSRPLRTTALRAAGVPRRESKGPLWQPLAHGVRGWFGLDPSDPDVRIRTLIESQPSGIVLGGWMALRVAGLGVMDGRTGPGADRLVPGLVHVGPDGRTRPQAQLHVDRGEIDPVDVLEIDDQRILSPTAAVVGIAQRYGVEEGLVAADAAWKAGLTSQEELRECVARRPGARGIRRARQVVELADPRAASLPESRLRYVWVVAAGLPAPLVNPTLVDDDGNLIGEPDLLDPDAGTVGEYDGAHHRDLDQHTRDNVREEGFESCNLTVVRSTSKDLWPGRRRLVWRLVDGDRRGRARDRRKDRFRVRATPRPLT